MIKRWWSAKQHICPQSGGFHSHCLLCRVWVCEAKSYRRGWLQSCSTSKDHGIKKNELHLNWVAFYLPGVLENSCFFKISFLALVKNWTVDCYWLANMWRVNENIQSQGGQIVYGIPCLWLIPEACHPEQAVAQRHPLPDEKT